MNKDKIRKEFISIRNNIEDKKYKSSLIINNVKNEPDYKNARIVALYKSLNSEVDTTELIQYTISIGKIVALPKVVNDELRFYKINSIDDKFIKSNFGVEEPIGNESNFVSEGNIDLVIVPGVCFDKYKNRLGFGKGYYDRFLDNKDLKKIGICFKEQIINEKLPVSDNDVKMDKIITEDTILF